MENLISAIVDWKQKVNVQNCNTGTRTYILEKRLKVMFQARDK